MPLLINLRHLEQKILYLKGTLPIEELDIESVDEMIHLPEPLAYDLQVEKMEKGLLIQGSLSLGMECECVRCLKRYRHRLLLEHWACHLALEGEENVEVINDCVDLTPHLREDILLAFPQHPLCEPECKGLPSPAKDWGEHGGERKTNLTSSAWAELNKLKFND